MSKPVQEGPLLWKKKKGLEERFFVLYTDRLEYYLEAQDHAAGQEPRGRIALQDIQSLSVTDDGFRIRLGGKDQDFAVPEEGSAKRWTDELERLVGSGSEEAGAAANEEAPSFATSPVSMDQSPASLSALSPACPFSPETQAAADAWPASPASTSAASPTASGQPAAPAPASAPQEAAAPAPSPAAAGQTPQQQPAAASSQPRLTKRIVSFEGDAPSPAPPAPSPAPPAPSPAQPAPSPAPPGKEQVDTPPWLGGRKSLCRGALNVDRKNKMVERYFVLLEDRLHYYEDFQNAEAGQEPRGFILMEDITRFEEREGSFVLQSRNEKKDLEFFSSSEEELARWVACWSKALKAQLGDSFIVRQRQQAAAAVGPPASDSGVVREGPLELVKEKKSETRHFVLFNNRLEYYSTAEDFAATAKPRGQVALPDIRGYEVAAGGTMVVTLVDRLIRLKAASPEVARSWGESWDEILKAVNLQVVWSQPGADSSGGQVPTSEDRVSSDPARSTEGVKEAAPAVPREAWQEGPRPICQGQFNLEDVGQPEGKTVVLAVFQDRLEYFARSDAVAGVQTPDRRIMVPEIQDLEVLDTGFRMVLHDGTIFRLHTKESAALNSWVEAFAKVLGEAESQPRLPVEVHGGAEAPSSATTATPTATPAGSSYSGNSSPTSWPVREGPLGGDPKGMGRRPSNSSQRPNQQQYLKDTIVHQGSLLVQRQKHQDGQVAARPEKVLHVVVYPDRFEYYADKASMVTGAPPQGQVNLSSVQQVRVQDAGFVLGLGNEGLNLRVPAGQEDSSQDMQIWVNALWTIFDPDRLAQGADAGAGTAAGPSCAVGSKTRPAANEEEQAEAPKFAPVRRAGSLWSKTDRLPEKPVSATELLQEAADPRVEQWLASLKERVCHSGVLGFQNRGKLVMKYTVMFEDRLDVWDGALMAASGRRASERIPLRGVRGVEAVFGGFILNCGGKRIGVHVNTNEELRAWSSALLGVIAAAGPPMVAAVGGAGARSRSSSHSAKQDSSPPSEPKKQRAHSVGWVPRVALLGSKGSAGDSPKNQVTMKKTIFTQRCEGKCFIINTHKACGEAGANLHGSYSKVMTQPAGGRHEPRDITGKVNECEKTPRVARTIVAETSLADKVTGSSPMLRSPRKEPGSLTWLKVNHLEAAPPPMTSRSVIEQPQPASPPWAVSSSQTVTGAAALPSARTLRRSSSAPITRKVNEVPWDGKDSAARRSCTGRSSAAKITDLGRERSGWAQHDRPASMDKARGIADRRLLAMSPR